MTTVETRADKLDLVGGRLCLDFTNTTSGQRVAGPDDRLTSYLELVVWGRHVGILSPEQAERLLAIADQQPGRAQATFQRAIALREALYRIFSSISSGGRPDERDLSILNRELAAAMPRLQVHDHGEEFTLAWADGDELERLLWPVARSAMELLTSGELGRVRECGGPTCSWLFVDTTKNHSRKWCEMGDCGNRAKARRHYERKKTGATPSLAPGTVDRP